MRSNLNVKAEVNIYETKVKWKSEVIHKSYGKISLFGLVNNQGQYFLVKLGQSSSEGHFCSKVKCNLEVKITEILLFY